MNILQWNLKNLLTSSVNERYSSPQRNNKL